MKRLILAATIALSVATVFADTQPATDCHHQCKAAFKHCKTLEKHSAERKACFKKAKADKHDCKMDVKKPAALHQNNNTQTANNTPAPAAAPQQPATAQ